jgi:hypothetical protein
VRGGPSIKHLDDVPAEEMPRYEFDDGRTESIWEKRIEMSPRYFAFWNKWDPGAISPRHGHTGDHSNLILSGELGCGDVVCGPGTHIMLEWGDVFGPWEAGPEGCELYGSIAGGGPAFNGDTTAYEALLKARGARIVTTPMPKRLPPWIVAKFGGSFTSSVTRWDPRT